MPLFSLIVPTLGRTEGLRRLLDSLRATAGDQDSIEAIAVIDEDDRESQAFAYSHLGFRPVVVPPGKTMGELNLAGYLAARGRYLMLLNDDVVARTPGWDIQLRQLLERYPDGIVLAHVNDLIFQDTLCTFPILTREFCEIAGGICRPEYRRYRIDDHIHHVFDLIHVLGHTRRIYLPDVIFEHCNAAENSSGVRRYVPNPAIQEQDTRDFEALIGERRRLALDCVERIEGHAREEVRAARARRLEECTDSIALRRREHARVWRSADWPAAQIHGERGLATPQSPAIPAVSPLAHLPFSARAGFWLWGALARAAARWPFLGRFRIGIPAVLFDEGWYLARYPNVAATGAAPLLHYLRDGGFQGYNPNPHFDTNWYLANYPDVAASGLNPLLHFVWYGAREGRDPNLLFDMHYYSKQNPEIAARGINPLAHFLSRPFAERSSPNASLTLDRYLRRLEPLPLPRIAVSGPAPLSIVIPTRNRGDQLMRTLDACRRHAGGCELEFVIVDDGSTDSTPELLRARSFAETSLSWHSLPPKGPGRARNFAAALARHEVLLFMGDDILPANDEFFRVHARRHAEQPENDFAVLGKVCWPQEAAFPVSFTMAQILEDGSQSAFSRLRPGGFASWRYFYTSNVSVKKSLVRDWMADGFDTGFPGAALEDTELAYRLWQSETGLRLYYDPSSVGLHEHPYKLGDFLDRQFFVGQSLRHMLQLHPELLEEYGLRSVASALREPGSQNDADRLRAATGAIESVEGLARRLEAQDQLGAETWHAALLSALFELRMHNGYASAWPAGEVNLAAARAAMLDRLFNRIPQLRKM